MERHDGRHPFKAQKDYSETKTQEQVRKWKEAKFRGRQGSGHIEPRVLLKVI